jgi:vacuolar iron transporter family protein
VTASHPTGQPPQRQARKEAERVQHEHADVTGGWLRPAVFGASDGLVSNFALIAGVAGAQSSRHAVVLAGVAGLAAGAFSMAAGEYISVRSQAEQARAEIDIERREIQARPEAEERELAMMYVAKGLDPELARQVAHQLSLDPDAALDVHVREELGIDPDDLPSARLAAGSSFLSFSVGAVLPLLPYLFGATSLWPATLLAAAGLFACGAFVTKFTPRPWWYGGTRQLVVGALAAVVTYGIGAAVGTGV